MLQRALARARNHFRFAAGRRDARRTAAASLRSPLAERLEPRQYFAYASATADTSASEAGDAGYFTVGSGCLPVTGGQASLPVSLSWGGKEPNPATSNADYTPSASSVTLSSTIITIGGVQYYQYESQQVSFTGMQDLLPEYQMEAVTLTVDATTAEGAVSDDEPRPAGPTGPATPPESCGCDDAGESEYPIRYFDGVPVITGRDLDGATGFGAEWGISRSFNTPLATGGAAAGPFGKGWVVAERPYLIDNGGSTVVAVDSAGNQRWFDWNGSAYVARFDVKDKLTTATGEFILTSSDGNVTKYYDFGAGLPVPQRGTFKSLTDPAGNVTSVQSLDGSGRPTDIRRSGGGVIESMLYAYVSSGVNAGLVESVTLRRSTDSGGTWSTVRSVAYTFYDGSLTGAHAFGRANYLRTATVKDAAGATLDVAMYRYYTADSATGQRGALKYAVSGDSYARLAADPAVSDPLTATDAQVATYADNYFEYGATGKVAKEIAQGAGCSSCTGGFGTFTFDYADNPAATGGMGYSEWTAWEYRTIETLPDGNQNISYASKHGQVLLDIFQELGAANTPGSITRSGTTATVTLNAHGFANGDRVSIAGAAQAAYNGTYEIANVTADTFTYTMLSDPGATASGTITLKKVTKQWRTFRKYDTAGRETLLARPSAVTGYSEQNIDLLGANFMTGNFTHLSDSTGLIETAEYGASTTATTSIPGDVIGYLKSQSIKQGETGTAVPQSAQNYIARTAGSVTVYLMNGETVYRNADGTGAQTTNYAYTFVSNTTHVESVTTTLPTITTAQNGPNSAASSVTVFDTYGRATWTKDAEGFINAMEYDAATGAVTKTIDDVNTATSTNEPSGWVTPAGGGLHLVTAMLVDPLGRTTKVTDPNGNVTHTVFKDADREVRVYTGWQSGTSTTIGPVEVMREDRARKYTETLTMAPATINASGGVPLGTEAISSVQSLSRTIVNNGGQTIYSDRYVDLTGQTYSATSATIGTAGTNYYRDEVAYDERGRVERRKTAVGTITWQLYDGLDRPTSTWIGTDDTGADHGDPDGLGAPNNMRKVSENEYDNGSAGDGNLTKQTLLPGGMGTNQVSRMYYDWRNRLVVTKSGDQGGTGEGADVNRQLKYCELDNLGQQTACEWYDADGLIVTSTAGVPDKPASSLRRARSETSFDEQGNAYRTKTISVDPSTGALGDALQSDAWRDKRGNVIKTKAPTGLVTKNTYDGAARVSKRFFTDGGGDLGWTDADDVTGDKVLEQVALAYDNNGNAILTTAKQRFHDATDTGELGDPLSLLQPKARVSYSAMYYDAANRKTADVNVGTNAVAGVPTAYTRPGAVPARSDSVLVNSFTYNSAGWLSVATDPKGIEARTEYDLLGRTTKTTEAYADGTPSDADDRITLYTYNGLDQVRTLKADLPTGQNDQTTEYVYGVTPAINSDIYSNDLLAEVRYPDKTTGAASTANSDKDRYAYSALGQVIKMTDRNASTHEYAIDVVGRTLSDSVTVLGAGVDGAVRRLDTAFDTAGRAFKFTSYDAATAGTVVNQVQRAFNGLGQLTTEYQEHSGAVNTGASLKVQYAYDTTASGGVFTKGTRAKSMTYPNGRVLRYEYTTGLDDSISRISFLADDSAGAVGTHLEEYGYLGLDTIIQRKHPEPGVDLSFITVGSTGDAGDQYTSLDRFGRVADMKWVKTSDGTFTDRFEYAYDRNSNRVSRDVTATGAPATHDEAYTYDNLDRLMKMNRGTLAGGTITDANATYTQRWDGVGSGTGKGLDPLGNWQNLVTDADGGGAGSATAQSRTHDSRNQLTNVAASTLTFDANGNTTTDETGKQFVYDAWNKLAVGKTAGGSVLVSYEYDVLKRRITTSPTSGTARDDYHSIHWQVIEEREGPTVKNQYVWSLAYVDAMVLRDRDAAGGGDLGKSGSGLDERVYAQHDANFNLSALTDSSGAVVERNQYLPYGAVTVLDANWTVDADGASDVAWSYLYQGGRRDAATGIYHFQRRDLNSPVGRWMQVDPIQYHDSLNLYLSRRSNPVVGLDPTGLSSFVYNMPEMDGEGMLPPPDGIIARVTVRFDVDASKCEQKSCGLCTGNAAVSMTWTWTGTTVDPANDIPGGILTAPNGVVAPIGVVSNPVLGPSNPAGVGPGVVPANIQTGTVSLGTISCSGGTVQGAVGVGMPGRTYWTVNYAVAIRQCGILQQEDVHFVPSLPDLPAPIYVPMQ